MRVIKFRAWTGKKMLYQDKQYLASFIRRIVPEIIVDHGGEAFSQHESYLPNGGVIDEYLMQFTGMVDKNDKDIYDGDIIKVTGLYGGEQYAHVLWGPVSNFYTWMNGETWLLHFDNEAEGPLYPYTQRHNGYDVIIIGNIWENEDLLK